MMRLTAALAATSTFLYVTAGAAQGPAHAPDGGTREQIVSIFIPPMANAPFSAVVTTEWVRHFDTGAVQTLRNHRLVARDGEGRIFQERRFLVPDDTNGSRLTQTEIADPAQRRLYVCHPDQRSCELHPYNGSVLPPPLMPAGPNLVREELGPNVVSGVATVGTRETTTLNAGAFGNDKPVSVTKEFWYSKELGVNVLTKRDDPRSGLQTLTVTNIALADPDPALFHPPADAKIVGARGSSQP